MKSSTSAQKITTLPYGRPLSSQGCFDSIATRVQLVEPLSRSGPRLSPEPKHLTPYFTACDHDLHAYRQWKCDSPVQWLNLSYAQPRMHSSVIGPQEASLLHQGH